MTKKNAQEYEEYLASLSREERNADFRVVYIIYS
jgi:hypothetical protein